jgi:hypothetical protein
MNRARTENKGVTDEPWCNHQDLRTGAICGKPGEAMGGTTAEHAAYRCAAGHYFIWGAKTPTFGLLRQGVVAPASTSGSCPFCPRVWARQANGSDGCGKHFWSPTCEEPGCETPTAFVRPRELEVSGPLSAACLAHKGECDSWFDVHSRT